MDGSLVLEILNAIKELISSFGSPEVNYNPPTGKDHNAESGHYRVEFGDSDPGDLEDIAPSLKNVCDKYGLDLHQDATGFDLNDYGDKNG